MKRFKFRLEGLYKVRKEEERQALFAVQGLRQKEVFLHQSLRHLAQERAEWICHYNQTGQESGSPAELLLIEQYLISLESQERHQKNQLRLLQQEIQKALEEVQRTYRARRQVEHVRERQKALFDEASRRIDRRETDDLTSLRHLHEAERKEAAL